ncbi:MAG TPA: hypothetical protein VFF33_13490 [Ignavibacteriaceae bacterium]|nr:hypothetical protein [Ignavibacteriaceae bacterium]
MKLVVFPGGADPRTTYKDVYTILEDEAKRRAYTEFILKNFPGHYSYDDCSWFSMKETVKIIYSSISELEKKEEFYIVLCRSVGCNPFIEFLKSIPKNVTYLKKVVLWGPSPYYLWYKLLKNDFLGSAGEFIKKGFRVCSELFDEIYPLELSISEISKELPCNIYITSGELDEFYPEHFRQLLMAINTNPKIILAERIRGERHAIDKYNKEYIDLIFE